MESLIEALDAFFSATAWEMVKPKPYGAFHILFTLGFGALSVFAAWKLRNLGDKGNRRLLLAVGLFLALTELYKQLFYFFYIEENTYSWGIFPFHLCSVPMYLCLIIPLLKPGKLQKSMYNFMMYYNLLSGAISFTEPSGLLHGYWTLTLHACVWHMLIFFVGLYVGFSGRGGREMKDYWSSTSIFLVLCVIAFCINVGLWDVSDGGVNMFFVGPRNSSIIVFKQISEMFGWYVSTALYIPAVCLGAYLIFLPFHLHDKRKKSAVG